MKVTIKDIARLANVSTTTVSKIINNKADDIGKATIDRVKKIIQEKNYTPNIIARSMVTKKTKTIGLIIPDVRNPFFTELVRGAEDITVERGYNLFFCNTDDDLDKEINYINALIDKNVDGIAIAGAALRDEEKEKEVKIGTPIVTLDRNVYFEGVQANIEINNFKGAYEAVKYLIELGHEKILYLSGPLDIKPSIDRLEGYKKALEESNIAFDNRRVILGKYHKDFAKEIMDKMWNKSDFTAIFCGNDLIAIGTIKSLKEHGLNVPNDISVVGFDDISIASFMSPALTTIRQPSYTIGYKATELLINIIEKKEVESNNIVLNTELKIRESTKSIREKI